MILAANSQGHLERWTAPLIHPGSRYYVYNIGQIPSFSQYSSLMFEKRGRIFSENRQSENEPLHGSFNSIIHTTSVAKYFCIILVKFRLVYNSNNMKNSCMAPLYQRVPSEVHIWKQSSKLPKWGSTKDRRNFILVSHPTKLLHQKHIHWINSSLSSLFSFSSRVGQQPEQIE